MSERCPQCGYEVQAMAGAVHAVCTECGARFQPRVERAWGRSLVSLGLVGALIGFPLLAVGMLLMSGTPVRLQMGAESWSARIGVAPLASLRSFAELLMIAACTAVLVTRRWERGMLVARLLLITLCCITLIGFTLSLPAPTEFTGSELLARALGEPAELTLSRVIWYVHDVGYAAGGFLWFWLAAAVAAETGLRECSRWLRRCAWALLVVLSVPHVASQVLAWSYDPNDMQPVVDNGEMAASDIALRWYELIRHACRVAGAALMAIGCIAAALLLCRLRAFRLSECTPS